MPSLLMGIVLEDDDLFDDLFDGPLTPINSDDEADPTDPAGGPIRLADEGKILVWFFW